MQHAIEPVEACWLNNVVLRFKNVIFVKKYLEKATAVGRAIHH